MATYSSVLASRIPWAGEPGGLQSTESHRVARNRSDLARMHKRLPDDADTADLGSHFEISLGP